MTILPLWKLKREAGRLGLQLKSVAELITGPFARRRYDAQRMQAVQIADGVLPAGPKIVLFLLFQPKGIPDSVVQTCSYLASKGYTPLVISNAPLSKADRSVLCKTAWKVVERPNYGYDFGGYRDGIWILNREGIVPDNLIIMNDSVWFPLGASEDLIDQMETSQAAYLGAQVFGDSVAQASDRKWRQPFFGSYFLMIKDTAFSHPDFQTYWTDYKLTSNKETTLHRGERAFSYMMFKAGVQSEGIYSRDRFDSVVAALDKEDLPSALKYLICMDPKLEQLRQHLLNTMTDSVDWTMACRDLIQASAETKNYIGSSPVLSIAKLNFPMIKKNNEMLYRRARIAILQAISDGVLDGLNDSVQDEIYEQTDMRGL